MGSDEEGRDLLSLIVFGARNTLWFVLLIVLLRYAVAIPLALVSTMGKGNPLNWMISKWSQVLSYLPVLVVAIIYLHLPFVLLSEQRLSWAIAGLALIEVGRLGLLFQEQIRSLSKKDYVESGIMIGNTKGGLLARYYWPAVRPALIVNFIQDIGKVVLLRGQLGFLQIYLEQSHVTTDFGTSLLLNESIALPQLLGENKSYIFIHASIPLTITVAISLIILTFYWLGEGLRKYYEDRNFSLGRRKRKWPWLRMMRQRKGENVSWR